jgi:hypothetical protein
MSNIQELKKIFPIIQNVSVFDWKVVQLLQKGVLEKQIVVLKSLWEDLYSYKNNSKYYDAPDLTQIKTWSTYDGKYKKIHQSCINLIFEYKDTKNFICYVKIYDGDILNGHRTHLRFTATLNLPIDLLYIIEGEINWSFNRDLEYQYDDYLEQKRQEWMLKRKQELLNIK